MLACSAAGLLLKFLLGLLLGFWLGLLSSTPSKEMLNLPTPTGHQRFCSFAIDPYLAENPLSTSGCSRPIAVQVPACNPTWSKPE
jgi:hypothetical protein